MIDERDIVDRLRATPEIVLTPEDEAFSTLCDEAADYIAKLRESYAAARAARSTRTSEVWGE